jgi:outer membrane receptor protein involved in Fe transport
MLQVLKPTPGILVLDSGISIKGSEPTVYINNRKVHLSSDELVELLESSSANNIKSIEVITNPSAKYDGESGTVVNIIMSKNLITGYRGSVFANYTQGIFPRYNVGTSHFFKKDKISFNLNYNYTNSKINREEDTNINYFDNNNVVDEIWNTNINRNTWSETHNLNFNFDYFINDNSTLSLSSTMLYLPYFKYRLNNNTVISDSDLDFLSRFNANNLSRDNKYNLGFDLDFTHQLEKGQIAFNSHFTTYDYIREQGVITDFFDQNNNFDETTAFNTDANQNTTIFTSKIDYSLPINDASNFEAGVKFSNVNTDSDVTQFDVDINTGAEQIDPLNSDTFNYDEKVYSAYSNYSLDTDKWSISTGLRVEGTEIESISATQIQPNFQDYLEWFPNASVQYNLSEGFDVYANYKRNITRPGFQSLNPFRFFINDSYVFTGNPDLQPTFLDHYVIGTTLFDIFTIEAYYDNYDGNISEIPRQNNDTNIIEYTSVNFDKTVEFGFDFSTYFNVTDNWSIYALTSFYNIEEETNFGNGFVKQDQWSNYSVLQNDITFLEDKSLNVNLALTWVGKNLQGLQTFEDRLVSELSISKTILNKKGIISLSVSDIFNDQDFNSSTDYLNQFNSDFVNADNRYIKIGFRYKFGNTKLTTNESTKEVEERDRLEKEGN